MTEQEIASLPNCDTELNTVEGKVMTEKELFLSKLPSEMRMIVEQRLKKKEIEKNEIKERAKELSKVTKEMLEGEYIQFDDDSSLSINELLVAKVTANTLRSNKSTFRDLNDAQKVIDNDTVENKNGFTLVLNTNGQDLGS